MNAPSHYYKKRSNRKKSGKGIWIVFFLLGVFAVIIFRIAIADFSLSDFTMANGMPTSNTVYNISQQFVKPTMRSDNIVFASDGYEFAEKGDSVYIIRSYADVSLPNETQSREYFRVVLKYKGGVPSRKSSWEVLDMRSN